jgi:hypothetical protein
VTKGLEESMTSGALAGFPVVDISATLYDGSYHEVDSSALAFQVRSNAVKRLNVGSPRRRAARLRRPFAAAPRPRLSPAAGTRHASLPRPPRPQIAARGAFRDAMQKCGARLLEPVMKVEVITPEDHMGDVIGDLNSRRGMVNKVRRGVVGPAGARCSWAGRGRGGGAVQRSPRSGLPPLSPYPGPGASRVLNHPTLPPLLPPPSLRTSPAA